MKGTRKLSNLCGIDVGCTNIKMSAFVGTSLTQISIPSGDNFTKEELITEITKFYKSFNFDFEGLGIAFSGTTRDGLAVSSTSLQCLENLTTKDFAHLGQNNIRFINDSNATALAGILEYPDAKVLIGITNGTGIGCGVVINGQLFTGANGLAGEIYGNPTVGPDGDIIKNGKISSGSKVLRKLQLFNEKQTIIQKAAVYMGIEIVALIHTYNPDVIYLSGGGFTFPGYMETLTAFINKHAYPAFLKGLNIVTASDPSYSGCFGAMKYVC